jgi:hypothetical protein
MKKTLKFIAYLLLGLLVAYAAAHYAFWKLAASSCGNTVITETTSPAKRFKAVVFQRDCGATSGFSTQVSIVSAADSLPDEAGNTFTSDTDHGAAPASPAGGPKVSIEWEGEDSLLIRHHPKARVFTKQSTVNGALVRYQYAQ